MTTADTGKVMIHGKAYETVASRVAKFRDKFPDLNWSITTEIIHRDAEMVVMKAMITNPEGHIIATGHAEEVRESSQINKTSALENAETSAIGRALAALGLAGTEFASADEVATAIRKQGIHKPSDGAMESLSVDMQTVVHETAKEVIGIFASTKKPEEALKWLEAANFTDAEAKIACWSLLPSDLRSAIKRVQEQAKARSEATQGLANMKDDEI